MSIKSKSFLHSKHSSLKLDTWYARSSINEISTQFAIQFESMEREKGIDIEREKKNCNIVIVK